MKTIKILLLAFLVPALPAVMQAQFIFTTNNGAITITGYAGSGGVVTIPDMANGYPVTSIGDIAFASCNNLTSVVIGTNVTSIGFDAFEFCTGLQTVTIPDSVTNIGDSAFYSCINLTGVYFQGNAPNFVFDVFSSDYQAVFYHLSGATGWDARPVGIGVLGPLVLWKPQMQTADGNFGVKLNRFGFNIDWASGQTVVVEACTNLSNPDWHPVQTNTLTSGTCYFSDAQWMDYPGRFYRVRSP